MEAATPNSSILITPKKVLRRAVFSPDESPRKLSRSAITDSPSVIRDSSFISAYESPALRKIRESFWSTLDISSVSQDNTYMVAYDPEVEQFEVDECTDAEYFTRGLNRSTPLKDSRKSLTAIKSPPTSKNVNKRSEREMFLEAQILELQRQLKRTQQEPEDITSESKDNNGHHVSFNISVDSDSDSHNSNCPCDACMNNMQNVLLENLMIACKTADLPTITYLLDQDVISVNIQEDKMGNSCLHFACANDAKGDVRVTQLLINKYKANKYLANDSGSTPLHYACINGFFDIVYDFIIHQGMSPDVVDNEGKTPLFNAAFNGHLDVVKLLVSCNDNEGNRYCEPICDVNARSRSSWTSLHCACYNGHYEVAHYLAVCQEADVSVQNESGKTAVHFAVASRNTDLVRMLAIECVADLNVRDSSHTSPLHLACHRGVKDIIRILLLREDIQVCGQNCYGRSALDYACGHEDMEVDIVQALLDREADPTEQGCAGLNAIHCASSAGNVAVLRVLLAYGGMSAALTCDNNGYNAVNHALYNGRYSALFFLCQRSVQHVLYRFFSGRLLGVVPTMVCITATMVLVAAAVAAGPSL